MNQQGPGPYGGVQPETTIQPEPPAHTAIPGYFGAATPPPGYVAPAHVPAPPAPQLQGRQMPPPVQPYAAPPMYYGVTDPKSQPLRPASFLQAIVRLYAKYATFSGRASRSEYWWVQLFHVMVLFGAAMLSGVGGADFMAGLYGLFLLGSFIPTLALSVRRLHDANFSGAMVLLCLVPYVGFLVVAILAMLASNPRGARFDRTPQAASLS